MQLTRKRRRRLRRTLLVSTCTLLGTTQAMADPGDWTMNSGVLYYSEVDRVQAVEPAVQGRLDYGDEHYLTLKAIVDTLSGATPTGAMPSSTGNTVTSASGVASSSTQPGTLPLDPNFHDLRQAFNLGWSQPISRVWSINIGTNYSIEHDYKSVGANLQVARDFNKRNTTLSVGMSFDHDTIFPIGGLHAPLSAVPVVVIPTEPGEGGSEDAGGSEGGEDSGGGNTSGSIIAANANKNVHDYLFGITQVMNRGWIAQLNYSYSIARGYQNDPYKIVSIINANPSASGSPGIQPPPGEPVGQIYENRPDFRHKRAVYLGNKVYLSGSVLDLSYRYGWDDWNIRSSTYELRYRVPLGDTYYVQPHVRYYTQTAADFYHRGLLNTDTVPSYVSADYRLAAFKATTVGLEFGKNLNNNRRFSLRFEYYVQRGQADPHVNIGVQRNYDMFPDLKAAIVQASIDF